MPSERRIIFIVILSMPLADERVLHPAKGMPIVSSNPSKMPSSPLVPCSTGMAT